MSLSSIVYFTKTAANTWEAAVYNNANASASGGFPYTPTAPLTTENYTFDAVTGKLTSADKSLSVTVPNGQPLEIDSVGNQTTGGRLHAHRGEDRRQYAKPDRECRASAPMERLSRATRTARSARSIKIPLADVPSPDNLLVMSGNVFSPSAESGDVQLGFAGTGSFGTPDFRSAGRIERRHRARTD